LVEAVAALPLDDEPVVVGVASAEGLLRSRWPADYRLR
jgi:hypothetical protein